MHGGVPPCDPRKSVEIAPPAAAYWRNVFECNWGEEKGGKGLQVCGGWRETGLAGPPVPGPHSRNQTVQVAGAPLTRSAEAAELCELKCHRLYVNQSGIFSFLGPTVTIVNFSGRLRLRYAFT